MFSPKGSFLLCFSVVTKASHFHCRNVNSSYILELALYVSYAISNIVAREAEAQFSHWVQQVSALNVSENPFSSLHSRYSRHWASEKLLMFWAKVYCFPYYRLSSFILFHWILPCLYHIGFPETKLYLSWVVRIIES